MCRPSSLALVSCLSLCIFAGNIARCAALPHFVEVTQQAGIDFRYTNGASGQKYVLESIGSGAAFFDADGDGFLDLYIVNGASLPGYDGPPAFNAHYRNKGDGTFVDITQETKTGDAGYGMGAAIGDVDNDGAPDLYVTNYGPNIFYRNRGNGTFVDITQETDTGDSGWGTHASFADIDNDGDLDLYVANYMAFDLDNNVECFTGTARSICGPLTYPGQSGVLYRNDSDEQIRFTNVTNQVGLANATGRQLAAVFGDIDSDGDTDLFVANDVQPNFLFLNSGDGTFVEEGIIAGVAYNDDGLAESAMGADIGDYDNDGRFDIVLSTFQWLPNTLYHNDGDGFFTDQTFASKLGEPSVPYLGMAATFIDYDNDGFLDVYITNGHLDDNVHEFDPATSYAQQNQLFRNRGNGSFDDVSASSGPGLLVERVSHGAALGDYDNDGDSDIFISDSASPRCTLLRNDGGNANHYLTLELIGTSSNREGLGARVRAVAGPLVQTREIRRSHGYMGSSDVRLLLGLGSQSRVDTLYINWPSGTQQTLLDIESSQYLIVHENVNN